MSRSRTPIGDWMHRADAFGSAPMCWPTGQIVEPPERALVRELHCLEVTKDKWTGRVTMLGQRSVDTLSLLSFQDSNVDEPTFFT